jgi:hypothetical protein
MSNASHTLQTLACIDPDYHAFAAYVPPELSQAELPPGLAVDIATYLKSERPELSAWIDTQLTSSQPMEMFTLAANVSTIVAALFLLRSHIELEHAPDGKISFKIKIKPAGSVLLKNILESLAELLAPQV